MCHVGESRILKLLSWVHDCNKTPLLKNAVMFKISTKLGLRGVLCWSCMIMQRATLNANYVIFRDMFPSSVRMLTVLSKTNSEILRCVCAHEYASVSQYLSAGQPEINPHYIHHTGGEVWGVVDLECPRLILGL